MVKGASHMARSRESCNVRLCLASSATRRLSPKRQPKRNPLVFTLSPTNLTPKPHKTGSPCSHTAAGSLGLIQGRAWRAGEAGQDDGRLLLALVGYA